MDCKIIPADKKFRIQEKNGNIFFLEISGENLSVEPYKQGIKITVSGENPEWCFAPENQDISYRWRMMVYPTFYSILNVDCGWSPTEKDDSFFGALPQKESHYHTVLYSPVQKLAVCAMFPGPVRRGGFFTFEEGKLVCRWEQGNLPPDSCYLFFDENAADSLQHIADESAGMPKPELKTRGFKGWNSWDYYLSSISEDILVEELQTMQHDDLCKDLEWFVIDEGWEESIGDWIPGKKFPSGMKVMAERIKESGFRPGIWTSPFMASVESRIYKENPEMFVKDSSGNFITKDLGSMGIFGVFDPTVTKVQQYLRDLFTGLKRDGYEYFKIDFITVLGSQGACFHEKLPLPEIVNRGLKIIRDSIGNDAYLLGCGMSPGAGFGIVDSMRICPDISTYWSCILASARSLSMYRMFHNNNWVNDPDFLIVRNRKTSVEEKFNLTEFPFVPYIPFTTRTGKEIDSLNEVEVWCALLILSGGSIFLSDKISALNEIGRSYVDTVLKYHSTTAAKPLNIGDSGVPSVWIKKESDHTVFAVFNFEDETKTIQLPPEINGSISGTDIFRNVHTILKDSVMLSPRSVIIIKT